MTDRLVAAYVRVSSASQTDAMQRHAINLCAKSRGDKVVRWYADTVSGGTMERSDLGDMRRQVRAGTIRKLYVFSIDRLTRTGIKDTLTLIEELKHCDCELVSVSDGFPTDGPGAELFLAFRAWAAKVERIAINERIAAARAKAEASGRSWGRPRRMSRLEVERAKVLQKNGRSTRSIAMALKVPRATIMRALKRPARKAPPKKPSSRGSKGNRKRKVVR